MQSRYEGIRPGTYGEKAIDIVANLNTVHGPELAARVGISVYETGVLKKAVQLGFLQRARSTKAGESNLNVYTVGAALRPLIEARGVPPMPGAPVEQAPGDEDETPETDITPALILTPSRTPPVFRPLNLARLPTVPYREGTCD